MPKAGSITPRKLIRFLQTKGFVIDHVTGSHYTLYHPVSGRRVIVAYHNRNMPKGTLHDIMKSAGLTLNDL